MNTKDTIELLRTVSGPIAMGIAAFAAAILGNWFASALAAIAAVGWSAQITEALKRHTADVRDCLRIPNDSEPAN